MDLHACVDQSLPRLCGVYWMDGVHWMDLHTCVESTGWIYMPVWSPLDDLHAFVESTGSGWMVSTGWIHMDY